MSYKIEEEGNSRIVHLTGEIDIQGNIKRIGGVYSKLEGAKFSGIKKVLLPEENRDDYNLAIKKHPNLVDSNFEVTFVKHVKEIIDIMIEKNYLIYIKY